MDSEPPHHEPAPPELPAAPPVTLWQKILWSLSVFIVAVPLVWLGGLFVTGILLSFGLPRALRPYEDTLFFLVPSIVALLTAWPAIHSGLGRNLPGRRRQLVGWGAGAVVMAGLIVAGVAAMTKVRESSRLKAMLPRQPAAAIDQFFYENPNRIFLKYDEIVGPDKYIKSYSPTDGEDLSVQFPIRQGWSDPMPVRLPDGTTVRRFEVLASIGKSGLIATYPMPQDDQYVAKRVYRLDCGVSFRESRVVNLPPDPAGREGRDQDGVHTYHFPDGRRYEITYRGGVPDGLFRAFQADGAPWGEATYRHGRVVEAWLIARDGRKFDELMSGEASQQAVSDSLAVASRGPRDSGLQKLGAKDYAGAIADLTRALAISPLDADVHRARGDAYRATGEFDRAIDDYGAAKGYKPEQLGDYQMMESLRSLVLARGHQRQQAGDTAGAARDFAAIGKDAVWAAEEMLRHHDITGAVRVLDPAIAAAPMAELHAARADARRILPGQQAPAEADYTQAIELAHQGKMHILANQRVLPAHWLYKRGHVRRWQGNFSGAAEDFRAALPSLGTGTIINRSDAACWLFLAQCEAGHRDDARRELQATDRADWWPAGQETARFLLGEITEAELDAAVAKSNQDGDRLKAELLSGLLRRLGGDEAGAVDRFRKAARRSNHDTIEMNAAQREAGQALRALAEPDLARGDFAAAVAVLKEAVAVNRPAAAGLLARYGDARRGAKDLEGAFATYTEALRAVVAGTDDPLAAELQEKIAAVKAVLEPIRQARAKEQQEAAARRTTLEKARTQGAQKLRAGDHAGAIANFTRAIELQPDAPSFLGRANARRALGDLDGAIADYTSNLRLSPHYWPSQYDRGHLRRLKNDLPGAAEDFRATIAACLKNNRAAAYRAAFWLYFTEGERGKGSKAAAELAELIGQIAPAAPATNPGPARPNEWDRQVADLLLGHQTEARLLAKIDALAAPVRQYSRFQALFFSAMRRRQAGDQPGALELFRQAVALPGAAAQPHEFAEAQRALAAPAPKGK